MNRIILDDDGFEVNPKGPNISPYIFAILIGVSGSLLMVAILHN